MAKNHEKEVRSYIENLDLSMVAKNMVVKLGWLPSEAQEAEKLYKNYLFLKYKYPLETLPPSEDMDEFWHNHILDTKKYKEDCQTIYGYYLDHYPYFGIDGITTMDDLDAAFKVTQKLHVQEFGFPICGVRYTKFSRLVRKLFVEKGVINEKAFS